MYASLLPLVVTEIRESRIFVAQHVGIRKYGEGSIYIARRLHVAWS